MQHWRTPSSQSKIFPQEHLRSESGTQRIPQGRPLHGLVFAQELSTTNHIQCQEISESFSDAIIRPAAHIFYGTLQNTLPWFKDKQHLYEYVSAHDGSSQNRIVFATNLMHGYFYGTLTQQSGVLFADQENMEYARFRRSITWEEWIKASQEFIILLNFPKGKKDQLQREVERLAKHMQNLRMHIPAGVPLQIEKSDLQLRFGEFATSLWLQWTKFEACEWPLLNLNPPVNPSLYAAQSSDVFPNSFAYQPSETPLIFTSTFFRCLENISNLNSQSTRHGIKSFESIIRCNDGLEFCSNHELIAPIFDSEKTSKQILDGCIEVAKRKIHQPNTNTQEGLRTVIETTWVESIQIIPLAIQVEYARGFSLFECAGRNRSTQEVAFSLSTERIGDIQNPHLPYDIFRYTAQYHPLCLLRTPWEIAFHKLHPTQIRYMETLEDFDYYIIQANLEQPPLWTRSPTHLRHLPFSEREPQCLGLWASLPKEVSKS
jgi:hypothetical protein